MIMKQITEQLIFALCLILALSSCDDPINDYDTRKDEYTVYYCITYSTTYDFHNIAYINYTDFDEPDYPFKYTGIARQEEHSIDGTSAYFFVYRVPRGAHIQLSTFVDVPEALPNTKAKISIEVSKGSSSDFTEVASAQASCPLKDNPLAISYDVPKE